jgi:hypothetical protein
VHGEGRCVQIAGGRGAHTSKGECMGGGRGVVRILEQYGKGSLGTCEQRGVHMWGGDGEELGMIWIRRRARMEGGEGGAYGQGDVHRWRGDAYASITN